MIEPTWYVDEHGNLTERLPPLPSDWRVPDLSHYITGYRAWRITYRVRGQARIVDTEERVDLTRVRKQRVDRVTLNSMVAGTREAWLRKQKAVASCRHRHDHHRHLEAPQRDCSCGIYAKPTLVDAIEYGYSERDPAIVYGAVALWGRVIVHTEGWRAQYAYPLWLFADERLPQSVLTALADVYGVKVHVGHIKPGVRQVRIYDPVLGMEEDIALPTTRFMVVATLAPQGVRLEDTEWLG